MTNKHQKLEQQILKCWGLKEDINVLANSADWTAIDPIFMDRLLSIASVYEMYIETVWEAYEEALQEYSALKPREVDFDEDRIDVVGQNGNNGDHYE